MKKGKKQKKESTNTNQPSSLMQKSNHPSPPGRPVPPHNLIQNQTNENEISIRFKDFLHFLHTTKSNIFLSLYWLSQVGFFFFLQQKNQMKERTTNSTRNDYSPFVPNNRIQNQKNRKAVFLLLSSMHNKTTVFRRTHKTKEWDPNSIFIYLFFAVHFTNHEETRFNTKRVGWLPTKVGFFFMELKSHGMRFIGKFMNWVLLIFSLRSQKLKNPSLKKN